MQEYLLPDVGEGLVEAEIVTWKVKVGDQVRVNDVVVEIETAKSLVELPSPYAGTVEALLVEEGQTVGVGTPIIRIGDAAGGSAPAPAAAPAAAEPEAIDLSNPAATGGGENQTLVGYGPRETRSRRRPRTAPATHAARAPEPAPAAPAPAAPAAAAPAVGRPAGAELRVLAKPPVRKLARDLHVDLAAVRASGPGGTITRADVESAAGSNGTAVGSAAPAPRRSAEVAAEWREPIKGVRKMMGEAMVASAFTAPHVTEWVTVDATRTVEFADRLRARPEFAELKVSPLLIVAWACLRAIGRTPVINSTWDEAAGEVVFKRYVNLGIAAATPRGLVVPNIKNAESLSLAELAAAFGELTATAREGRTQPAEMAGGTFTITNVGVFGVDSGTPIINPGESAILAFGQTARRPWVVTDSTGAESLAIRDVCTLALSFDHRHVDGASGSRFLADVAAIVEDPATSLVF